MRAYTLEIDELAALCGFLNAKKLVGLDEGLFRAFSEENLPRLMAQLRAHGWIVPAERKDTWHLQEDLMQTLAVAVAPQIAVLARSVSQRKSIVFYMAGDEVTEIVITEDRAVVASLGGVDEIAAHALELVSKGLPGEIVVARVNGESFDAGHRAEVDASGALHAMKPGLIPDGAGALSKESVAIFMKRAIADIGVAFGRPPSK